MREYLIYDMQTDELIGSVYACSIVEAERKACGKFNVGADDIYALTNE